MYTHVQNIVYVRTKDYCYTHVLERKSLRQILQVNVLLYVKKLRNSTVAVPHFDYMVAGFISSIPTMDPFMFFRYFRQVYLRTHDLICIRRAKVTSCPKLLRTGKPEGFPGFIQIYTRSIRLCVSFYQQFTMICGRAAAGAGNRFFIRFCFH